MWKRVPRPLCAQVVGFCSVELRKLTSYEPPAELKAFLDAGPPPVYIGFGSLVVDNPTQLTNQFLQAIERTGLRAIIQRGWGEPLPAAHWRERPAALRSRN